MRRMVLRIAFLIGAACALLFWPLSVFFAIYGGYVEDAGQPPVDYTGQILACLLVALAGSVLAVLTRRPGRRAGSS